LALVVGIVALAVVRFVRLFLDGVAAGRVRSSLLEPHQAPVARVVVSGVVLAVAGLLVVAAFFLRFGTSVEQLVLLAGAAVALGAVPFFANAIAGLAVQWRQPFAIGDHVRVGSAHGEVVRIRLNDVLLVPEEGGTITVPMLALLLRPLQRMPSEPRAHIDTVVARSKGSDAVLEALQLLVAMLDERGTVEVRAATATTLNVRLIAGRGDGAEQRLWRALLRACDTGEVRLAERNGRDPSSDTSGPLTRTGDRP
jgi:small-conductance mechanosensitive channel